MQGFLPYGMARIPTDQSLGDSLRRNQTATGGSPRQRPQRSKCKVALNRTARHILMGFGKLGIICIADFISSVFRDTIVEIVGS